jgi:hypothetical protein
MLIKGLENITTAEAVKAALNEQYERACSNIDPTTVNVYVVCKSHYCEGTTFLRAYRTYCVFSKEQAIRVAEEAYNQWSMFEAAPSLDPKFETYVTIRFDNKTAVTHHE